MAEKIIMSLESKLFFQISLNIGTLRSSDSRQGFVLCIVVISIPWR